MALTIDFTNSNVATNTSVNAISYTTGATGTGTGGLVANVTTLFIGNNTINTTITAGSITVNGTAVVANSIGIFTTGTVNAVSHTVGTSFVANTTLVLINGIPLQANGSNGAATNVLTSNGSTGSPYWAASSGGATITNDTATSSSLYVPFTSVTSGTMSSANVSSTKLYFVPSTGLLSATGFNSLSDKTLKENIKPIDSSIIQQINPVEFTWKENGIKSYGVIAQELETVLPELVYTDTQNGLKSVSYSQLIPFLIDKVKDLQEQIDQLKKKIDK